VLAYKLTECSVRVDIVGEQHAPGSDSGPRELILETIPGELETAR
jgi:hypothetical protein